MEIGCGEGEASGKKGFSQLEQIEKAVKLTQLLD